MACNGYPPRGRERAHSAPYTANYTTKKCPEGAEEIWPHHLKGLGGWGGGGHMAWDPPPTPIPH